MSACPFLSAKRVDCNCSHGYSFEKRLQRVRPSGGCFRILFFSVRPVHQVRGRSKSCIEARELHELGAQRRRAQYISAASAPSPPPPPAPCTLLGSVLCLLLAATISTSQPTARFAVLPLCRAYVLPHVCRAFRALLDRPSACLWSEISLELNLPSPGQPERAANFLTWLSRHGSLARTLLLDTWNGPIDAPALLPAELALEQRLGDALAGGPRAQAVGRMGCQTAGCLRPSLC